MTNNTLQAIETRYKGFRFRSRLEARWAVFFDAMEISWTYENEGYVLSDGTPYLPDFWLPEFEGGMFAEVKPTPYQFVTSAETDEQIKWECFWETPDPYAFPFANAVKLCFLTGKLVWLCGGIPTFTKQIVAERCNDAKGKPFVLVSALGFPRVLDAYPEHRMWVSPESPSEEMLDDLQNDNGFGLFYYAVNRARSARFEHGQSG